MWRNCPDCGTSVYVSVETVGRGTSEYGYCTNCYCDFTIDYDKNGRRTIRKFKRKTDENKIQ